MKKAVAIFTFILFFAFSSCNNPQPGPGKQNATPKALDDKSSYDIISKRGYGDLVENLYSELAKKDPELSELEKQIEHLNESRSDSAGLFSTYNGKNQNYYQSAGSHVGQMKDTVVKQKIKQLIEASTSRYNRTVAKHTDLLRSIDNKHITLHDLHTILKITRTLPLIEQYQEDAFPSTSPLEGYSRQLDKTIRYADTLTKK